MPRRSLFQIMTFVVMTAVASSTVAAQTVADSLENNPWHVRTLAPGVMVRSSHFDKLFSLKQLIHVVEADMDVPGLAARLLVLPEGARKPVSAFARDTSDVLACVNGNFIDGRGSVQHLKVDGELVVPTRDSTISDEGGIAIDESGDVKAMRRPDTGWESRTEPNIMATNMPLVVDGKIHSFSTEPFYQTDRHPRTAVGVTTGNKLLLVVVDGRSAIAQGMTFVQLAETMLALGAHDAVNMDGGGSTTLWDCDTPGNGVVNIPSGGPQRPVNNAIALIGSRSMTSATYAARRAPSKHNASDFNPTSATLAAGQSTTITLQFVNTGTAPWKGPEVMLIASPSRSGAGSMYTPSDWTAPDVATGMDEESVSPGGTGNFTFVATLPTERPGGRLEQEFGLVSNGGKPFGPQQNRVYLTAK